MTNPVESVPLQAVHMPLNMDPETATYVGMLEGTIAALVINDCKQRTLLELLTGDGWEAAKVDFNGESLIDLAASSLVKQTGMSLVDAQILVKKRWNERNHPSDYVVPQAVTPESYAQGNPSVEMVSPAPLSDRVKAWRAQQLADALKAAQEATATGSVESGSDSNTQNESATVSVSEQSPVTESPTV
jgi:hypothetical protein